MNLIFTQGALRPATGFLSKREYTQQVQKANNLPKWILGGNNYRILLMRLSSIILTIIFGLQLATAGNAKSQSLEEIRVTLEFKGENLKSVFKQIEKKTDLLFAYPSKPIDNKKAIHLPMDTRSVKEILDIVLEGTSLTYHQVDNNVIISLQSEMEKEFLTSLLMQEDRSISGKVTDSNGKPLPSATIMIKGTLKGITTDLEGNYTITVPNSETVLVFSYVGFAKQEIKVGNKVIINVTLEQAATELGEVLINAGYYKTPKKLMTGSISKVGAKVIEQQPVSNPLQALQGRAAGVYIQQQTGVPGGGFQIRIRGRNSLRGDHTGANDPLYLVNGVPFPSVSVGNPITEQSIFRRRANPLNSINPNDIESIEILKDADATAIYGSRGANGVVLITTKKAKKGKAKFEVNSYTGFAQVTNKMELLNTEQYLEMRREALVNDGFDPLPSFYEPFFPDIFAWDDTRYTDWQEELIGGTAAIHSTQLSFSGGNENTQFLLGTNYFRESTVFPGDFSFQRLSGNVNINHISNNKKLNINFSANYTSGKGNLPQQDFSQLAVTLAPNAPEIFDEDGELNWENGTWNNPFGLLRQKYNGITNNLITNVHLKYKVLKGLSFSTNLTYNIIDKETSALFPIKSSNPQYSPTGQARFADSQIETWIVEPQIEYQKSTDMGKISILLGTTFQQTTDEGNAIIGSGYTSDALLEDITAAPTVRGFSSNYNQYKYNAIFGRINYNFKSRYILNLTGRKDASSRFGPDKKFGNFGAIGAAWIFSNENFLNEKSFLSFGKLRASYGSIGNDRIPDYEYLSTYKSTNRPYDGAGGLVPTRLANSNFSWETIRKFEVSLDLGFLKDHIFFSASYYRNRSSSQLLGFPLPQITGFSTIQRNNKDALIQNTGWEFELSTINIQTKDVQWTTDFNISFERNKLVSFPGIESSPFATSFSVGGPLVRPGYIYTGIDPETGLYTFEDIDGNGTGGNYPGDLAPFSNPPIVNYYGGLQNTIRFRNLEIDFLFQFVKKTNKDYRTALFNPPGSLSNQPIEVLDRWQQPGDVTNIMKYTFFVNISPFYKFADSDGVITDASYVRLKNLSISYNFPKQIIDKIGLQSLRLYLQGQNLFTITNFKGLDPETLVGLLPPLRTITFGFQVTL